MNSWFRERVTGAMSGKSDIQLPKLLWLFGKVGSGKSYIAELVSKEFNYHWYEGDDDLTPKMVEAIQRKETFTQEMRDEFYGLMSEKIKSLCLKHETLVVSQALYRQKNRDELKEAFPELVFVWVRSGESITRERLLARGNWVDPEFAKKKSVNFEEPDEDCLVLENDDIGFHGILDQFNKLFARK